MLNIAFLKDGLEQARISINEDALEGQIPADYEFMVQRAEYYKERTSLEELFLKEINSSSNLMTLMRSGDGIKGVASALPSNTDAAPIKRVLNYKGLSLGITHEPGDTRFGPLSTPLTNSYGHIRRSSRAGRDKLALDVYTGSGEKDFRVRQIDPATGAYDEDKFMLGFSDMDEARLVHMRHAGVERFGTIEPLDLGDLQEYRTDVDGFDWNEDTRVEGGGYHLLKKDIPPVDKLAIELMDDETPEEDLGIEETETLPLLELLDVPDEEKPN